MFNSGKWTQARFNSFIKSALRAASNRWPPKYECRKEAWIERGKYKCAGYKRKAHIVSVSVLKNKKRKNNITVDHIIPVIDPVKGFVSWDETIKRMFCEKAGLQVLCLDCHSQKTQDEKEQRKKK